MWIKDDVKKDVSAVYLTGLHVIQSWECYVCVHMWVKAADFFAQRSQVALEISACHQLHNHQGRLSLRDHAQQPHLHESQQSTGQLQ